MCFHISLSVLDIPLDIEAASSMCVCVCVRACVCVCVYPEYICIYSVCVCVYFDHRERERARARVFSRLKKCSLMMFISWTKNRIEQGRARSFGDNPSGVEACPAFAFTESACE